jgi:O-antigen/teichoic acid export membrane protein
MAMKTKGLGDLLAGNIIFRSLNIACTVLITFLLTRLMGTGGYGVLSLLVANAAIFNLLTCLGAESGITYHYASGIQRKSSLFSIAYLVILFQIAMVVLAEGIYHAFSGQYFLGEWNEDNSLLWGLLYFVSIVIIDKYQAFFNAAHLYTMVNRIIFLASLLSLLVFFYCYFFYPSGNDALYLKIFILASVLQAAYMVLAFHQRTKQPLRFGRIEKSNWKVFFSYSIIVLITNIIQFLAYRVDYWFVDYFHGKEQLGLYSLAVKLGQVLWILPLLMAGILFPRIAADKTEEEETIWLKLIRVANVFFLIAAALAALLAGWIIPMMAGKAFSESVIPFIYLLPGLLFFCFNIIFAAYFAGKGLLKINLTGSVLCLSLVLIGDFLLIPHFGIKGAAIASSLAYTAAGIHHLYRFASYKKLPVLSVVIINRDDWNAVTHYLRKYTGRT